MGSKVTLLQALRIVMTNSTVAHSWVIGGHTVVVALLDRNHVLIDSRCKIASNACMTCTTRYYFVLEYNGTPVLLCTIVCISCYIERINTEIIAPHKETNVVTIHPGQDQCFSKDD